MKYFAIYDKATGEVLRSGICTDPATQVLYPTEAFIEANAMPGQCYVKNGHVREYPRPAPEAWFEWDLDREMWVSLLTDAEEAEAQSYMNYIQFGLLRSERDQRLAASDWSETPSAERRLGPDLFAAWASYRQALRDLPAETTDPANPVWPTPPKS